MVSPFTVNAQYTTGSISGTVRAKNGEPLQNASIQLIHEPTGTVYLSKANKKGDYQIQNITPGGPYLLQFTFIGFATEKKSPFYINLGDAVNIDVRLIPESYQLNNVTVSALSKNKNIGKGGTEILINRDQMEKTPTVGRNIYDYLRTVPQVKLVNGNEGAVSLGAQNNRYNAFYVDGAVNNDVFGLSASGTNGGQAGIAPLSVDAIDQFQISLTPYDVSVGNFTGGTIHAITRSGTNQTEGSAYHFFRNKLLTGKNNTDASPNNAATYTTGLRLQGAFTPNKLFYFLNMEIQRDRYPIIYDLNNYTGYSKDKNLINILYNKLKTNYGYDAGSIDEGVETVNADRLVMRIDWNINQRNKISISNRYTAGQRRNINQSNENEIHFSNDGFLLNSITHSVSVDWGTVTRHHHFNKFITTFTSVKDDRGPLGKAFPRVRINDGNGAILFGTDNSSTINLLTQQNITVFDKYSFISGSHHINFGLDIEYNKVLNAFIQNSFGIYTFSSLGDFLNDQHPSAYQLGFSLIDKRNDDQTNASAKFSVLKTAFFLNDVFKPSPKFSLQIGIRAEKYQFLNNPAGDDSLNLFYLPKMAAYYNLQNSVSGRAPFIPLSLSPRIGFIYRSENNAWTVHGGAGIFSGRIPLAWPGGIYNNNGIYIGGYSANRQQLNMIRFRQDAYKQWGLTETGASVNKEPVNLISEKFSMPDLFRTSIIVEKKINTNWSATAEIIFSKNLTEIKYTNINLMPPADTASGPDKRLIYSIIDNGRIPLTGAATNPYDYIILLSNNKTQTGYAQIFTTTLNRRSGTGWDYYLSYTWGRSFAVNEGTASVNLSQWRLQETVNGRNAITRSVSDFSSGHKIMAWANKKYFFNDKKMSLQLSIMYTGQSGSRFSYVYGNMGMTRDDGVYGAYDLIYIPTRDQVSQMIFLQNTVNGKIYSPDQQKEALEKFLQTDPYLQKHRGQYAERNASRTPFTNRVDLQLKQDCILRMGKQRYQLQFRLDIFNLGNLINSNWGLQYEIPFDHFTLIDFAGYTGSPQFIPQYRFNPEILQKESRWQINTTRYPAYASHWSSQIGIRITFK